MAVLRASWALGRGHLPAERVSVLDGAECHPRDRRGADPRARQARVTLLIFGIATAAGIVAAAPILVRSNMAQHSASPGIVSANIGRGRVVDT
jgi:hypothetical protein